MKEYGQANLADLTIEMMHSYLHDTVIKSLVLEENEDKKAKQYSWGCAKNLYRRQPLKMKRGKTNFRAMV
jgi:hypothetical protein